MERNGQAPWTSRHSYHFSRDTRIGILISTVIMLTIAAGLFICTFIKQRTLSNLAQHEQVLTKEVMQLDELNNQKKILEADSQQLDLRLTKIQKVICSSKNNPHQYLRYIEHIIPEHMILTNFIFNRKTIRFEGLSSRIQEITKFMRLLSKSNLVKTPRLITLDRNRKDGQTRFVIDVKKI